MNRSQLVPSTCAIDKWVENFDETLSTTMKKPEIPRIVPSPGNVDVMVAIERSWRPTEG